MRWLIDLTGSITGMLLLALSFSCGKPEDGKVPSVTETTTVENGIVTVKPFEYYNAFRNPMKGWREFFGPGYDRKRDIYPYPFGSMIKEYMQWNMMEDTRDDGVDKVIAYSNHRWEGVEDINVKVIPRPFIVWMEKYSGGYEKNTYTDNPDDLNGWHWPSDFPREIRSEDDDTPSTGGYFDPDFQNRMVNLVKKLAEAWDDDPRVAYIEMGLIGEFGEQHDPSIRDFWKPHTQDHHVAGRTWIPGIEKTLGDAFSTYFKHKKVMVRYAYDFQDYDFGYYWDSWAYPEEDERGYNWYLRRNDFWKRNPMGGELTWNYGTFYNAGIRSLEDLLADKKYYEKTKNQIRSLHANHLGGVTWADWSKNPTFFADASQLQKIMGYHFIIKEFSYPARVEAGGTARISFDILNTGSGPFYYDWPVEISLMDPQTKTVVWRSCLVTPRISTWMPGDKWDEKSQSYTVPAEEYHVSETISLPSDLAPGKYAIGIAVLDPAGNLPSLRFAVMNYWQGGRHPMGYIGVGQDITEYKIPLSTFDDIQSDKTLHYEFKK